MTDITFSEIELSNFSSFYFDYQLHTLVFCAYVGYEVVSNAVSDAVDRCREK